MSFNDMRLQKMNNTKKNNGSVTIEASISLTFFLCVVISIAFFIKVIYTHEILQHALNQTALEISELSYLYYASGTSDFLDKSKEDIFQIMDKELSNGFPDMPEELKEDIRVIIENLAKEDLNKLFSYLAKRFMQSNLSNLVNGKTQQSDEVLEKLNIIDGIDGLDMSLSGFFNDSDDIELIVKYKVRIPVPIDIFSSFCLANRTVVKAWLYGDEAIEYKEDIWSLDNFTRGRKVRDMFGANLPFNFPVIARYEGGIATMIKSMDLTATSYQDVDAAERKIKEYINELLKYNGQQKPWGKDQIIIDPDDIKIKKLLLVIPENELKTDIENVLKDCNSYAYNNGILLEIKRYGYKADND